MARRKGWSSWKQSIRKVNGKRRRVKTRHRGRGKKRKEQVRVINFRNTTDRGGLSSHRKSRNPFDF